MKSARTLPRIRWWAFPLAIVVLLVAGCILFQWNWLRGPIGELVHGRTGRPFVIAGNLDVTLRQSPQSPLVRMQDVRFDNPAWARDPHLVTAREAEFSIDLGALMQGRLVFPHMRLSEPDVSLERAADGQRNWVLKALDDGTARAPEIRQLAIDRGVIRFRDPLSQADVTAQVTTQADRAERPTTIAFSGTYKKVALSGEAQAGPVLSLQNTDAPFPMWLRVHIGDTVLEADGSFTDIGRLAAVDARLKVRGSDWSRLYPVIALPLPSSPPYSFDGRFKRAGGETTYENFAGRIGSSDISGSGTYFDRNPRPLLKANLHSRVLDLKDLGPIIGARPQAPAARAGGRVLPSDPFKLDRLNVIDADVTLKAQHIRRPDALPLEHLATHLRLNDRVLTLDPLDFGIAGGAIASAVTLDARQDPIRTDATIQLRKARLSQLFPTVKLMKDSSGLLGAHVRLSGRGNSVAAMLAGASGELGVASTGGDLSNLLIEIVGLDGGEIIKFLVGGDRKTAIRCAVASFKVQDGLATSQTLVLDTVDTNIGGAGRVSLRDETIDLTLRPEPKDKSILAVRSPIHLGGTFSDPSVAVEKGPLALRAGAAILLGMVNPFAALIPLIETGPGTDSNCAELLASVEKAQRASGAPKASHQARTPRRRPA